MSCWLALCLVLCTVESTLNLHAQVLWSEGFEQVFPGAHWTVGDANPAGPDAYWEDVDYLFGSPYPHSGEWSAYVAGNGFGGDNVTPTYQNSMRAYMRRTVDLTTATTATLNFWFDIPSLGSGDLCQVYLGTNLLWSRQSATLNWEPAQLNLMPYIGRANVLSFEFTSDTASVGEGWYLDDIQVTATSPAQPNLAPYQPQGWSDSIVVSRQPGTMVDTPNLQPSDTLYLDWAVNNSGNTPVNTAFRTELYVDDVLRTSWNSNPPLAPNSYIYIDDYLLGSLSAGPHTLRIRTDADRTVNESNEQDNDYIKTIVVSGTPDIRVEPLTVTLRLTNDPLQFATTQPAPSEDDNAVAPAIAPDQKLRDADVLLSGFQAADRVKVLVNLATPRGRPGPDGWSGPSLTQWQTAVRGRQEEVLSQLPANESRLRHRFENQAGFSAEVSAAALDRLLRHPHVLSVEPVRAVNAHLAQGIPLMNALIYRGLYDGAGVGIAIVDSGVDYNHPRLGDGGFPNQKVIGGYDFGDGDNNPLANANAHGTAVAGIAAGNLGVTGDYVGGVAPGAKIYALKVTAGSSASAFDDDIIAAWNWCITHKNDDPANPILVINTSFGSGRYSSICDGDHNSYATAARNALAAGITLCVSSGNEGYCNALSAPACLSNVLSIGAVYDASSGMGSFCVAADSCVSKTLDNTCPTGYSTSENSAPDKVPLYSNTASFLTVLAPAHDAYTTDIPGFGGYALDDYTTFGGTSAASPYAAGAVAALQSAARAILGRVLTPEEVRTALTATGNPVTDGKSGIITPRINVGRAIESLGQNASFTIYNDGNAPLVVTGISTDTIVPWLSWFPPAPFTILPGRSQPLGISINATTVPPGTNTTRLLLASNDPDENPVPGGVYVTVQNMQARLSLQAQLFNGKVVISWPANSAGFVLQRSDTITSASSWLNENTTPATIGDRKYVTNNITGSPRFYRLRK